MANLSRREAITGFSAAAIAAGLTVPALAAEPDARLLELLAETRRLYVEYQFKPTSGQTMAQMLAPAEWRAPLVEASALPARTEAGRRAKAELISWLICAGDDVAPCWACPSELIGLSLCRDVLGEGA